MRTMIQLALTGSDRPARAVDLARAQGMSKGYLEGLLAALRRAGLVTAVRGPGGGWLLSSTPARTKAAEVYAALEGPTALSSSVTSPRLCGDRAAACARTLWVAMTKALDGALARFSVADLARSARGVRLGRASVARNEVRRASKRDVKAGAKAKRKAGRAKPKAAAARRPPAPRRRPARQAGKRALTVVRHKVASAKKRGRAAKVVAGVDARRLRRAKAG
jgi:Rrf2 family iron-sulfur cluster assembly transcriptional regulator